MDEENTPENANNVLNNSEKTQNNQENAPSSSDRVLSESEKPAERTESRQKSSADTYRIDAKGWFRARNWSSNPFTFSILPSILVGYDKQKQRILLNLEEKHKFILISGPTGSGKTTLMKWVQGNISKEFDMLYISKPPKSPEQFVEIFNEKFRQPWFLSWRRLKSIYQLPEFLNKRLKKRHLVVLFDEAHESSTEILEWLRVLGDQVDNISFLLSGLPVFEEQLISRLETFNKRIAAKIELLYLTKEETKELVRRRIQNTGGSGNEFNEELLNAIYEKSGGFPREILRQCDEAVNNAIINNTDISLPQAPKTEEAKEERITVNFLDKMTPMQKEVIEMLAKKPLSPGQVADSLNLSKYKSRQHAVRSVNNIVKKLQADGYLERVQNEKTFVYSLTPKIRTLMVKA